MSESIEEIRAALAEKQREKRVAFIAGCRAIADFYETHPAMTAVPYPEAYVFCCEREEFLAAAKELASGGKIVKSIDGDEERGDFTVTRDFGGMSVKISIRRKSLCRLVRPAVYDCPNILEAITEGDPDVR